MARAKICGLRQIADLEACIQGGAVFAGFVDFPRSPRHLEMDQAMPLLRQARGKLQRVLLTVDAQDQRLEQWMNGGEVDMIQCQGKETAQQISSLKRRFGLPVIKAVGVGCRQDVQVAVQSYATVADWLLFEAKPPVGSDRPGGNAKMLDWSVLQDVDLPEHWILAGGLTSLNVGAAIQKTKAPYVDVSSGVEGSKGVKDTAKIAEFLAAVEAVG